MKYIYYSKRVKSKPQVYTLHMNNKQLSNKIAHTRAHIYIQLTVTPGFTKTFLTPVSAVASVGFTRCVLLAPSTRLVAVWTIATAFTRCRRCNEHKTRTLQRK